MKSLMSGVFWGGLSGGIVVTLASLAAPQPAGNTPPKAPLVESPSAAVEAPQTAQETIDVVQADPEPEVASTPSVDQPDQLEPLAQTALPEADTTPLDVPTAGDVDTTLATPDLTQSPVIAAGSEDPVLPNPQSVAPQVPATEDDLVLSTQPAAPPAPEAAPVIIADDPPAPIIVAEQAPATVAPEDTDVADADAPLSADSTAETVAPEVVTPPAIETDIAIAPDLGEPADEVATTGAPELVTPDIGEPAPEIVIAQNDVQNDSNAPQPPVVSQEETVSPEETAPVVVTIIEDTTGSALPTGTTGVVVNRSIGSDNNDDAAPEETPVVEVDPDAPALARHAAVFENPDSKPTMSLIVVDEGDVSGAVDALGKVPFPVTVAIDPTSPGANDAMAAYRAAGIEVVALAKLPTGAQPSDVEVAFGAAFAALPESVAMIDTGEGNLQDDRAVLSQAMAALAEDGRGLITVSQGLNTGLQAAAETGVPAGLIFRDLDGDGQNARVIRRFLDQAAFRARQEDGVVLLARLRPETLNALISWGEANRAGQVAMAPVSAVLSPE